MNSECGGTYPQGIYRQVTKKASYFIFVRKDTQKNYL